MTDRLTLPQGTLELLILKALALQPLHGWALSERLSGDWDSGPRRPGIQRSGQHTNAARGCRQRHDGYFGEQSPLGKVMQNGGDRYTVVGVVKDSRQRDLTAATAERRFYVPLLQTDDISSLNFVVQTRGSAASTLPIVRRESQE